MNVILPTKSCVVDPIPTTLLKTYSDDLVPLICGTVDESVFSGPVPPQLKEAFVTPPPPPLFFFFLNYRSLANIY